MHMHVLKMHKTPALIRIYLFNRSYACVHLRTNYE